MRVDNDTIFDARISHDAKIFLLLFSSLHFILHEGLEPNPRKDFPGISLVLGAKTIFDSLINKLLKTQQEL
jgi:hypothetical protein